MMSSSGHLFHIDFSNILGNFMKFGMFERETAPFVLTPEMVSVIGGKSSEEFQFFIRVCQLAFNILRRNANIFITMMTMMLSTGIPYLKRVEDLYYLRNSFHLEKSDEEAAALLRDLIKQSLNTVRTRVNNAIHIMANPN